MRAVGMHRFGGPEVLEVVTCPMPSARRGQVVVRVAAATVNPTDLLFRAGRQASSLQGAAPPFVPGMEFAGVVHEIGDEVQTLSVGQPVMGIVDPHRPEGGAQAEYVAVSAASVIGAPDRDLFEAATIPMNGLTAMMAIEELEAHPGGVVLVTGGAGAVGGYAIQLANLADLTVVADAKDEDVALLRGLGADHVVPRGRAMVEAVRSVLPHGVDHLVDAARLGPVAMGLVRAGGTAVTLRSSEPCDDRLRCRSVLVGTRLGDTEALRHLAALTDQGLLTPRVSQRVPMNQAADAHRLLEVGGLRGRVVIDMTARGSIRGRAPDLPPADQGSETSHAASTNVPSAVPNRTEG